MKHLGSLPFKWHYSAVEMAAKYLAGVTVYEMAAEFGCHRSTVAEGLKKVGIALCGQSPTTEAIDSKVLPYATGPSHTYVGK